MHITCQSAARLHRTGDAPSGIVSFTVAALFTLQTASITLIQPLYQLRQFQEILVPEQTPARRQDDKWIRRQRCRPRRWNRAHAALRVVEVNSIFAPVVAVGDQPEPLASERMVRVNDFESCFAVVAMRCS
jgi:hypothetical protein